MRSVSVQFWVLAAVSHVSVKAAGCECDFECQRGYECQRAVSDVNVRNLAALGLLK